MAQLPLPVLLTDTSGVVGRVVSHGDPAGEAQPPLEGQPVENFLDIGALELSLQGKSWVQEQVPFLEEGRCSFCSPPNSAKTFRAGDRASGRGAEAVPVLDTRTGAFLRGFIAPRCEEELAGTTATVGG